MKIHGCCTLQQRPVKPPARTFGAVAACRPRSAVASPATLLDTSRDETPQGHRSISAILGISLSSFADFHGPLRPGHSAEAKREPSSRAAEPFPWLRDPRAELRLTRRATPLALLLSTCTISAMLLYAPPPRRPAAPPRVLCLFGLLATPRWKTEFCQHLSSSPSSTSHNGQTGPSPRQAASRCWQQNKRNCFIDSRPPEPCRWPRRSSESQHSAANA